MRVLVFGGSFDPVHRGHAAILKAAANAVRPGKIIVVPAWHAPLKIDMPYASAKDRVIIVRRGILDRLPARWRKLANIDASEIRSRRPVYTVETLSRLHASNPGAALHFVCGADSASSFARWKDPTRLKRLATWWVGARPGAYAGIPPHFKRLPGRFPDVSSTEIRAALALGQDCSKSLFPEVLAHIERRGLYDLNYISRLKDTLKPLRYEHTLNVAALADALARRYGLDGRKARTAGLLHDMGRRYPPPLLAEYVKKHNVKVPCRTLTAALEPMLLHAYVSEHIARTELHVIDEEILSAVRKHTLGDAHMSALDKVLYVADACSADRVHPGVEKTRALAFSDLDAAFERCLADKLAHALARRAWLHPLTIELWNILAAR